MTASKPNKDRINHARAADAEALALLKIIKCMNRIPIEHYLQENPPNVAVIAALAFIASSSAGKDGAAKRHKPMASLRDWTVDQYRTMMKEKKWPSANKAAHDLMPFVIKHSSKLDARMSTENAQRTIADWIRRFGKSV